VRPLPVAALQPVAPAAAALRPPAPAASGFGARLEARLRPSLGPPPQADRPLGDVLRGVEAAQARLDQVLAAARRGQAFTAGQLLVLQAEAYRFTQALDLAGKLVEQGVQAVKQAVNTPL
jgi:hypothetical protein